MKRMTLFSLVLLGLLFAVSAASSSADVNSAAVSVASSPAEVNSVQVDALKAQVSVGVVSLDEELALLSDGGVTSNPVTCTLCLALPGACNGGAGSHCADNCTCQWCGGSLGCRPSGGSGPGPHPTPVPDDPPVEP